MQVIPSIPPEERELQERIQKLVTYVARNGIQFEAKVREKEANNPNFEFLRDETSEDYNYYKWMLFIAVNNYSVEQVQQMKNKHNHKLEWKAPGTLDLTAADEGYIKSLLQGNNGSKDAIKSIRKWVLDRSHSVVKIGLVFRHYGQELRRVPNTYSQLLHTAYVVNDIFYNSKGARLKGPYTRLATHDAHIDLVSALLPNVLFILRDCYLMAENDAQKEKVTRLIELWTGKGFVTDVQGATLSAALISGSVPAEPEVVELASPYLEDPLPSNAPTTLVSVSTEDVTRDMSTTSNIPQEQLEQLLAIQQKIQEQLQQQQFQQQHMQHVENLAQMQHKNQAPFVKYPAFGNEPPPSFGPVGMFAGHVPGLYPPGMFHPPSAPQQSAPFLDLTKIPVGNMANIVRAAKRAGHPPHTPLDVMIYAPHAAPHVEPGRVEVRIADFYKHVGALLNPAPPQEDGVGKNLSGSESSDQYPASAGRGKRSKDQDVGMDERDRVEESWVKYVPGYEDEKERSGQEQDWHRHGRKAARHGNDPRLRPSTTTAAVTAAQIEIAEDNVGHKLLRGLGWQQGLGLGAANSGIVEPISAKPASDRGGIGLSSAEADNLESLKDGVIDYSAYRKQRSTTYHSRISERDPR